MSTDQCVKGINWGEVTVDEKNLTIKHNKLNLIKIPVKKIVNSITQKNDIVMQLNTDDCDPNDDMLCEIRFYVPPGSQEPKQKQERKKQEDQLDDAIQEESVSQNEEDKQNFQQQLQNDILTRAKIGQTSVDSIVSIADVPLVVPRGKYTMDLFRNQIRFHGSTYQFTTEYKSISKFFMLPMPDEINMSFVIGLDKPLKQGQTTYNYMVMQFRKDFESEVKLKYSKEKLVEIGWLNIQQEYKGALYEIVCQLLSEITGVRVVIPKNFKSKNGIQSLRCSVGPHQGFLFPLEKSLIHISKPVIQIRHEDIREVVFQRISQSNLNKLFDMKIISVSKVTSQLFAGIDRGELDGLSDYFQSKKIKVSRIQEDVHHKIALQESDDEDIDDDDSRQEDQKKKKVLTQQTGGNLDSDEDDEDFEVNPNQDDGSDSPSDISEEDDDMQKKKR